MNEDQPQRPAILILGPTGVGKTALSLTLAKELDGEIINADTGQFYTSLSIGTAKPNEQVRRQIPHHLFDIVSTPNDLNAYTFRVFVTTCYEDIVSRGKQPIIVGGSMFYIRSLFFPPHSLTSAPHVPEEIATDPMTPWERLNAIDPIRARALHPNDHYRIQRSLDLWKTTGRPPSMLEPMFNPALPAILVYIDVADKNHYAKILESRTRLMLDAGWREEALILKAQPTWWEFIIRKGFCGYQAVGDAHTIDRALIDKIVTETNRYAKRQRTFWRKLARELTAHGVSLGAFDATATDILSAIRVFLHQKKS